MDARDDDGCAVGEKVTRGSLTSSWSLPEDPYDAISWRSSAAVLADAHPGESGGGDGGAGGDGGEGDEGGAGGSDGGADGGGNAGGGAEGGPDTTNGIVASAFSRDWSARICCTPTCVSVTVEPLRQPALSGARRPRVWAPTARQRTAVYWFWLL